MPLSFENGPLRAYQAIGDPASAGAYLRTARPDRNLLRAAAKDEEPDTAAACRAHPHAGWFRALAGVATKRRPVFGRGDDFGP